MSRVVVRAQNGFCLDLSKVDAFYLAADPLHADQFWPTFILLAQVKGQGFFEVARFPRPLEAATALTKATELLESVRTQQQHVEEYVVEATGTLTRTSGQEDSSV